MTNFETEMSDMTDNTNIVEEDLEGPQNGQAGNTATHPYNLQPRPTKHHEKLNLMQVAQQSTYAIAQNRTYTS